MNLKIAFLVSAVFAVLGCNPTNTAPTSDASPEAQISRTVTNTIDFGIEQTDIPTSYAPRIEKVADAQDACTGAKGEWLCKRIAKKPVALASSSGQQPIYPPALNVANWHVDPANNIGCASDQNNGLSQTCTGGCSGSVCPTGQGPLLTFGEAIFHRIGGTSPTYPCGNNVTFHKHSAQVNNGADAIWFTPRMCGGGQAQLIDDLVPLDGGMDVAVTTVTPKAPDAGVPSGGQLLQVQGLPTNVTPGMFVCNVSRSNSCAFIDVLADAGVAIMEQPITNASFTMPTSGSPAPTEDNTWNTGDTVNVFTENGTNLKAWNPIATDVTDAGVVSGGWVQYTNFQDPSLTATSVYPWVAQGLSGIAGCKVDTRIHAAVLSAKGTGVLSVGNYQSGQMIFESGGSTPEIFGGGYTNGIIVSGGATVVLAGDSIVRASTAVTLESGTVFISGGAFFAGSIQSGSSGSLGQVKLNGLAYGPGGVSVKSGSFFNAGGAWGNMLMTGALTLETATTGSVFTPGTGLWSAPVTLNIANLTSNHTLKNPNNGATFTDTTP